MPKKIDITIPDELEATDEAVALISAAVSFVEMWRKWERHQQKVRRKSFANRRFY